MYLEESLSFFSFTCSVGCTVVESLHSLAVTWAIGETRQWESGITYTPLYYLGFTYS